MAKAVNKQEPLAQVAELWGVAEDCEAASSKLDG